MIKVGIIGMGIRGNMFAQLLEQNPFSELTVFSETDKNKMVEAQKNWGVPGYESFREMLEEDTIDAVIITTPDFYHKEPVLESLKKNLHILLEKPFSQNIGEAEEMLALSQKVKTKCMVAFENRWNPVIIQAKNQIETNKVGNILSVNALQSNTTFVPLKMIPWADKTTCGWFLLSHLFDMSYYLTKKKALSVYAHGTKKYLKRLGVETYDYIHAIVHFEDGTDGLYESMWCLPETYPHVYDVKMSIYGENGYLNFDFGHQMIDLASDKYKYLDTLFVNQGKKLIGFPGFMLDAFIDNIRMDQPTEANFEDGYYNTKLLVALHRSLEKGNIEKV